MANVVICLIKLFCNTFCYVKLFFLGATSRKKKNIGIFK